MQLDRTVRFGAIINICTKIFCNRLITNRFIIVLHSKRTQLFSPGHNKYVNTKFPHSLFTLFDWKLFKIDYPFDMHVQNSTRNSLLLLSACTQRNKSEFIIYFGNLTLSDSTTTH